MDYCHRVRKLVEIGETAPGMMYISRLRCPECGVIDTIEDSEMHLFNVPDWLAEILEGIEDVAGDM